jgi:hypothetical protein
MRLISVISFVFLCVSAQADIIFAGPPTGVSEYINFNANDADNGFEIAGGITSATCATGTGVCNSCADGWVLAQQSCNMQQISPSTEMTMTFSSTEKFGNPKLTTFPTTQEQQIQLAIIPTATTAANQQTTIRATWANICGAFDTNASATCAAMIENQTFKVGIDGNNDNKLDSTTDDDYVSFNVHIVNTSGTAFESPPYAASNTCANGGFCNFTLKKGDEKATVQNLQIVPSGLSTYKSVIFLCTEGNDASLIDRACTGKVAITGANALANDTIEGMQNGVEYVFRAATVDIAGNIGLFLEADRTVTPDAVEGLFGENSCFIATAAYGSPMEKHVKTLKAFRDQVLRKSTWGQIFVQTYYMVSPPLAKWIAEKSERRSVARMILTPIVWLTAFTMESPILFFTMLFSIIGGFAFWFWPRKETLV